MGLFDLIKLPLDIVDAAADAVVKTTKAAGELSGVTPVSKRLAKELEDLASDLTKDDNKR